MTTSDSSLNDLLNAQFRLLSIGSRLPKREFHLLTEIIRLRVVPSEEEVFSCEMGVNDVIVALVKEDPPAEVFEEFQKQLHVLYTSLPKQDMCVNVYAYVVGSATFVNPGKIIMASDLEKFLNYMKPFWEDGSLFGLWMENRVTYVSILRWEIGAHDWTYVANLIKSEIYKRCNSVKHTHTHEDFKPQE